ncbi:MAG: nucleotide disphospho-sugar-binding domain-containing protein [Phycisphaeraceae bacterium]
MNRPRRSSSAARPVLFLVESISVCHIARPLAIASVLRKLGIDVVFAAGENHRAWIEEKGFTSHSIPVLSPETVYGRLRRMQPTYHADELENYVAFDLPLIRELNPRLIISDMRLTASLVGQKLGIPTVSICNGVYSPYFHERKSTPFFLRNRWHLPQGLLDAVYSSALGRMLEPIFERPFAKPIDEVYRRHGIAPLGRFSRYMCAGDRCLIADLPRLAPLNGAPDTTVHIGPCLWDAPAAMKQHRVEVPKDAPAIYISMGTSVFPESLVGPCITALLEGGYRVVLQTGSQTPPALPTHPRLQVHSYVSNLDVMRQVDVVVSHGGVSTGYEALSCGVPVIGIPSFSDQQWNADRVAAAGAGMVMNPAKVSPASLLRATNRLRDEPGYKAAAKTIAEEMRAFSLDEALHTGLAACLPELSSKADVKQASLAVAGF